MSDWPNARATAAFIVFAMILRPLPTIEGGAASSHQRQHHINEFGWAPITSVVQETVQLSNPHLAIAGLATISKNLSMLRRPLFVRISC